MLSEGFENSEESLCMREKGWSTVKNRHVSVQTFHQSFESIILEMKPVTKHIKKKSKTVD